MKKEGLMITPYGQNVKIQWTLLDKSATPKCIIYVGFKVKRVSVSLYFFFSFFTLSYL